MKKKNKKRKLNKKRVYTFLIILLFFVISIYYIINVNITNIYISGNKFLTDQEVIDIAKLSNYPKSISNLSLDIKKSLEKNKYINKAKVTKNKLLKEVNIEIEENYPLFYYQVEDKYVLYDGTKIDDNVTVPNIINHIPNKVYDKFIIKIRKIDRDILNRISEIKYDPNEVDDERFFLIMNDGNYVYITVKKMLSINKYLDMVNSFDNKKGILHLDSGEYFSLFD